ncbi:MAG: DUF2284 domain-containing protein [Eubacteriales bacterium]|nr:DUF2284 domain-containing protein [Eubacteriales bacterium]
MISIDEIVSQYPIVQYQVLNSQEIPFSEKVRHICRTECERYGRSWSCPPAVGEVKACRQQCLTYKQALIFTTLAEVSDASIMSETLATRAGHEDVTRAICEELKRSGAEVLPLSSESCQICEECAYPNACRFPGKAIPCVESYGILVTEIAEKCGMEFYYDSQTVTWFGIIFFNL